MMDENRVPVLGVKGRLSVLGVAACLAALVAPQGTAATLSITNTADSGAGSLRQAMLDATNGLDEIIFQIPGTGVQTIVLLSALPAITHPVVIDGTTQPGYAGTPLIEINGAGGDGYAGLRLQTANSTIKGLAINRFATQGLLIQGAGSNLVQGNFIGTDPSGTIAWGNSLQGIWLNGSSGNLIGGTNAFEGNLIAGNGDAGLYLLSSGSNTIQGNFIGTTATGTAALRNANNGIYLRNAPGNMVGGVAPAARNVISGNGGSGVYLYGLATTGNLVQGNYIGTDTNGSLAMPNAGDGVTVNGAGGNTIGGTDAGAGNLLSGNSLGGVSLYGAGTDSNLVQGNFIGTDASGRAALGNTYSGITILGGNSNLIGGATTAARNIISANKQAGVYITTNSVGNLVQGNFIGVDATGAHALGNATNGILISSASLNTVGGTTADARNIISGNTNYGIEVFGAVASGNLIEGNYIGPSATGQSALGNTLCGVHILSPGNKIGGSAGGAGNLISGNGQDGIFLDGASAANNVVQGNFIGTAAGGTSGLMNVRAGVGIFGAPGNTIGGITSGAGNLISANANANGNAGLYLIGSGATGNLIQGNKIGTDVTGTLALGNTHEGIYLDSAPSNTIGGIAAGAGNLISANHTRGILLTNASWNVIQGNLIGTEIDGVSGLGNVYHAVECTNASNNLIGGTNSGAGNRLAFSQTVYAGVRIRGGSTNDAVLGNAIFSNGGLGIDLGPYLVNANVPCDAGSGDNMLQNYPILTQAVSGNGTGIRGTLNSRPNRAFLLQFFANPACDSSGYGEGQIYLGQMSVVTGNDCNTSFVAAFPASVPVGYAITATATDSANNTSEFSACVPVGSWPALSIIWPATFAAYYAPVGWVPVLSVSSAANGQVALAWTNTTITSNLFVLKQTDNLLPPVQWTTVTNRPVVINGQFVVTLSANAGSRFYVLSSSQSSLVWTNTATGFVLKQTDNLSPPVQWTTVTNSPVVINGQFVLPLSADVNSRFYVLSFQ
jgi:titin